MSNTKAASKIMDTYNIKKDNQYFDEDLIEIKNNYELSTDYQGQAKTFIKKIKN